MALAATVRARGKRAKEIAYKLTSKCHVCERLITPGQTWKFTPEGRKVHYYCAKQNPASLDLSWLQEGDTFAPDFGGQELKRVVTLYRNSDGRELTVAVDDVLAFNSEPVRLSKTSPYRKEVGIWATPIIPGLKRRGYLRDSRYSLVFRGDPGYAYGEKWVLGRVTVENPEHNTLEDAIRQEGRKIAHRFHPEEWRQPASWEYFRFKLYQHPEDVIPGWSGMLPQEKQRAEKILFNAYLREAGKILEGAAQENPAGPTFAQAMAMARQAGARIGDTAAFEGWLVKSKLDTRGPQVRQRLEREFWRGVEHGEDTTPALRAAKDLTYKGVAIYRRGEGYRTDLDPESEFESLGDAKRFVDAQARNPRNPWPAQYAPLDWDEMEGRYVAAEDLGWFMNRFVYVVVDTTTGEVVRERGDEGKVLRSGGPLKAKALAKKLNRMEKRRAA